MKEKNHCQNIPKRKNQRENGSELSVKGLGLSCIWCEYEHTLSHNPGDFRKVSSLIQNYKIMLHAVIVNDCFRSNKKEMSVADFKLLSPNL